MTATVLILPEAAKGDRRWLPPFAGAGFGLWVVTWFAEGRAQKRIPALTTVLAAVALSAALLHSGYGLFQVFKGEFVRAWNVYHYYVGSKYFAELGYFDLYRATLVADDDWQAHKREMTGSRKEKHVRGMGFGHITRARDMHSYKVVTRESLTRGFDRSSIRAARLDELGKDTRELRTPSRG